MKVSIGKYRSWIGPYQIASALCFWAKKQTDEHGFKHDADWVHNFGTWLAEDKDGNDSWLNKVCEWIEKKRGRNIKIKIHEYDTWSMDSTLALIIYPMLKQLKEQKHGSALVDDEDVPEHLRSTNAKPKENEWDTDEFLHDRWDWVLDEMIWAFEQMQPDCDGDNQFFTHPERVKGESFEDSMKKMKVDTEGLEAYSARIARGTMLFGKYYKGLWT
jgi:hypothetical protein